MFEKVKEILVSECSIDENDITMDADLINDLGLNSLELADLILICEEEFDIEIEDDDLRTFITVGDIVNYLNNL